MYLVPSIMPDKHFYCSLASAEFGESLHGTASRADNFLLISHSEPFPEKLAEARHWFIDFDKLQQWAKAGKTKLLLVRNEAVAHEQTFVIYVDAVREQWIKINFAAGEQLVEKIETAIQLGIGFCTDMLLAICANGNKDKCCSKFGIPVYEALKSKHPNVFQCSHLGGDRFAANMAVLPQGHYYGRLRADVAPEVATQIALGNIVPHYWRGRSTLDALNQTAEYYAREHYRAFGAHTKTTCEALERSDKTNLVRVRFDGGKSCLVSLMKQNVPYDNFLSCKAMDREDIVKYQLLGISEVS